MIFEGDSDKYSKLMEEFQDNIQQKKQVIGELKKTYGLEEVEDKEVISSKIEDLTQDLKKLNERTGQILDDLSFPKNLFQKIIGFTRFLNFLKREQGMEPDDLEKVTLKRLKKGEKGKKKEKKDIKEDEFAKSANKMFGKQSKKLVKYRYFETLEKDLDRANLKYTLPAYVSIILFVTFLSFIGGLLLFLFFLFFSVEATMPIIEPVKDIGSRLVKLIWMLIVFPLGGFIVSYIYPSMEKKSAEAAIDYELPFATINMAAIAGSMINPVKIFEIIISSDEFPSVKRELTRLMNHINIYGYDVVSALRSSAFNTPSKKMSELFNGLATTINSGGDMAEFFDKRAESLLFDYKIRRESETKTAETFMDLYISIVIAAPMIFMLLLMMLKISGLGVTLTTSAITLIMVGSVTMINIFFLIYLHLKKTGS